MLSLAAAIWAALLAKGAKDAAEQVKKRISNLDTLGELTSAIAISEEIMRLQRAGVLGEVAWHTALERHGALRLHLVRRCAGAAMTDAHRNVIQTALAHFRIIMKEIEDARTDEERGRLDTSRFNRLISSQLEHIENVRIAVKKAEE